MITVVGVSIASRIGHAEQTKGQNIKETFEKLTSDEALLGHLLGL